MTEQTTVVAMPGLNEAAPPFTAKTTPGTLSLEDSKGKWLVLFSDPADFTPVCTTEFMAFTQASADFTALNCEPMGLSIEGIHAHIAWARSIKDNLGVEINFPIIADLNIKLLVLTAWFSQVRVILLRFVPLLLSTLKPYSAQCFTTQ
ncbi:redoxin domain-containing protein [Shewanella sp. ECSMB14102]|uniref:redoxin domain-containing protein n=1 Tax=Shewanella sp. ECSMB14102 TaxID=1579504 RepID=UPI001F358D02|nr:redoxin domain-containing protein [Shewanella sp. ECSMB14102]